MTPTISITYKAHAQYKYSWNSKPETPFPDIEKNQGRDPEQLGLRDRKNYDAPCNWEFVPKKMQNPSQKAPATNIN